MTMDEELAELRAFKAYHEGRALNRAFNKLEQLMETVNYDPMIGIRAFKVLSECLVCLKEEMKL